MHNNNYQQETDEILELIRKLEEKWVAQDFSKHSELEKKHPNPLFKSSGVKVDSNSECPRCAAKSWSYKSLTEACRMNGDAYGYEYTYCEKCGLARKHLWDEYC